MSVLTFYDSCSLTVCIVGWNWPRNPRRHRVGFYSKLKSNAGRMQHSQDNLSAIIFKVISNEFSLQLVLTQNVPQFIPNVHDHPHCSFYFANAVTVQLRKNLRFGNEIN